MTRLDPANADRDRALALTPVSRETLTRLDGFVNLLRQWQAKTNLVAPSTLPEIWTRHIADSLQLFDLAPEAKTWVDFGAGGGFPGLVLACRLVGRPGAVVHLVESNSKKAAFLREAARVTGAAARIHAVRIENSVESLPRPIEIVTARALASLKVLLDFAAPLIQDGAQALFLKGQDVEAELTEASRYWKIEASLIPSKTDPRARIVHIRQASRLE